MNCKPIAAASLLAAATFVLSTAHAAGPVSLNDAGYNQNFDSLPRVNQPVNTWTNGGTVPGWYAFTEAGTAITSFRIGSGGDFTGALYSVGNSAERALGMLGTRTTGPSNFRPVVALALTNDTGRDLDQFELLYDVEQWRYGDIPDSMTLSYRLGNNYATTGWTSPGAAFNATGPVSTGTKGRALDGNLPANRRADVGGTMSLTWAAGETLWVRWVDVTSSDSFTAQSLLAIDNVRITVPAAPIPEAETWAMLLAGLATLGFVVRRRQGA